MNAQHAAATQPQVHNTKPLFTVPGIHVTRQRELLDHENVYLKNTNGKLINAQWTELYNSGTDGKFIVSLNTDVLNEHGFTSQLEKAQMIHTVDVQDTSTSRAYNQDYIWRLWLEMDKGFKVKDTKSFGHATSEQISLLNKFVNSKIAYTPEMVEEEIEKFNTKCAKYYYTRDSQVDDYADLVKKVTDYNARVVLEREYRQQMAVELMDAPVVSYHVSNNEITITIDSDFLFTWEQKKIAQKKAKLAKAIAKGSVAKASEQLLKEYRNSVTEIEAVNPTVEMLLQEDQPEETKATSASDILKELNIKA